MTNTNSLRVIFSENILYFTQMNHYYLVYFVFFFFILLILSVNNIMS